MTPPQVQSVSARQAPDSLLAEFHALKHLVWPKYADQAQYEAGLADFMRRTREQDSLHFYLRQSGEVAAHARYFVRVLKPLQEPLRVACLAAVCVRPEQQGRHLGRLLMEEVFREVARGRADIFLLQTGVPGFYEKLGARQVFNRFYDGRTGGPEQDRPWWEPHVMIYPASRPWPTAEVPIDIDGPGF